jgi:2-methylcitrate dehydratase PrpD
MNAHQKITQRPDRLAERLGEFVATWRLEDTPAETVADTKRLMLDTFACMLGGTTVQPRHDMFRALAAAGGAGRATVLGTGERLSAAGAALVNAEAGAALSAQDSFFFSHTANLTLAVALALCEQRGASGRDLLTAFLVGFETTSVADLLGPARLPVLDATPRTTPAGTRRPFVAVGAAAAAARALGLGPEQTRHALTIAAAAAPGDAGVRTTLSCMNYYSYHDKAQAGISAAVLGGQGFTGHPESLEALLQQTPAAADALEPDRDRLIDDIGRHWWIRETCIKLYPTCRYLSGPVDLFASLVRDHDLAADEIEAVTVRLSPTAAALPMIAAADQPLDPADPATPLNLVFNAPYQLALLASRVPPGPDWFDQVWLTEPAVLDFMRRVRIEVDEDMGRVLREDVLRDRHHRIAKSGGAGLSVRARGQTFTQDCDVVRGDPWSPSTRAPDDVLVEKLRVYSAGLLPDNTVDDVADLVLNIESLDDMDTLVSRLVPRGGTHSRVTRRTPRVTPPIGRHSEQGDTRAVSRPRNIQPLFPAVEPT